jgi:hypothetical protein
MAEKHMLQGSNNMPLILGIKLITELSAELIKYLAWTYWVKLTEVY